MDVLVAMEECDEVLRGNYGGGDPTQFRCEPSVRSSQIWSDVD